jgi:rfaE bifunctional protein nucleotidyltransferase chain/domain
MHTITNLPSDYRRKIVTADELERIIRQRRGSSREQAPQFVQCHGCFDIVHPGHIRYLQFARSQGDVLIVSITGDALIDKGDQRPYIPQELRAENLAALELVDYVVIDPNETAVELLGFLRPEIYVKGQEYAASNDSRFLAEKQVVEAAGGRVIFSSGQVVFSSTRLAQSLPENEDLAVERLRSICRRHDIDRGSLSRLLTRMRSINVLIVGDCAVDRYVLCESGQVAGESPMMSLHEIDQKDFLGEAGAVAMQAAALGARTTLVTALGSDDSARWARDCLTSAGVQLEEFRHRTQMPLRTRFLADDHKLLRVDCSRAFPMDSLSEKAAIAAATSTIAGIDRLGGRAAVVLYDCNYGMLTPGLLNGLTSALDSRRHTVSGSFAEQGTLKTFRDLDLLYCSERKLRNCLNDFGGGLSTLAYQSLQATNGRRMISTVGKRGLVTFDRRSHDPAASQYHDRLYSEYLPSLVDQRRGGLDRLGCGETGLTLSSMALAVGANLMQASYLSAATAALQIHQWGIVPFGPAVMESWFDSRPELLAEPRSAPTINNSVVVTRPSYVAGAL